MMDFFRRLFAKPKTSSVKKTTEPDQFVIIDAPIFPANDDVFLDQITSNINIRLLNNISNKQKLAYILDNLKLSGAECCVCLEHDVSFVPMECAHPVCTDCYLQMITKSISICPLCRKDMEVINVNKSYAILLIINVFDNQTKFVYKECLAIVYLPPIYNAKSAQWKSYDVFYDLDYNAMEITGFKNAVNQMKLYDYVVVIEKPQKVSDKIDLTELMSLKKLIF